MVKNNRDWSRLLRMLLVDDKKKSNSLRNLKRGKVTNTPLRRKQDVKRRVIRIRCQRVQGLRRLYLY